MAARILPKSTSGTPHASQSSPTTTRPKKASMACTECQKRKSRVRQLCSLHKYLLIKMKCHGGVPCNSCRQDKKDCFVDEESDGRRKLFSKRKIESLERDRALLIRLLGKIRDSNRKDLDETIEIIRGGASLADLTLHLPPLDLTCETPATRGEVIAGNGCGSKTKACQGYLDIQNIIE